MALPIHRDARHRPVPGEPLSRLELAELVNAYVLERSGRTVSVDDHYVGKLERGVIRWPQADYRHALRAVLRVESDAALGFRRPRRSARDHAPDVPSAALVPHGTPLAPTTAVASVERRKHTSPEEAVGRLSSDLLLLEEWSAVYRRHLLAGAATLGALAHLNSYLDVLGADPQAKVSVIRAVVTAQRRREGTVPAQELAGVVVEHLRLLRDVGSASRDPAARRDAAEALSEGFGFLAWLAWDMWEIGSAERYYTASVRLARESGHPTLPGYMIGSLATFSAKTGSVHRALDLVERARHSLPARRHPTVDAWLSANASVAYAAVNDAPQTERLLADAEQSAAAIAPGEAPPWPWVMKFDAAKLAGYRLSTAVQLRRSQTAVAVLPLATSAPARSHSAQYALTRIDEANVHSLTREYDRAATVLVSALEDVAPKASRRVLRAASAARDSIPSGFVTPTTRHLDALLRKLDPVDV